MLMVALKIVVICALTSLALSCSCLRSTFESIFCRSAVSVRGKVIARFDNCKGTCDPIDDQISGRIFYIVQVLEQFKGTKIEDNLMFLGTGVNSALCGINLQIGLEYLFNLDSAKNFPGTCPDTVFSVGLCNFPAVWSSLTAGDMSFVRSNANGGSECP